MKREKLTDKLIVQEKGVTKEVSRRYVLRKLGCFGIIRLRKQEFDALKRKRKYLTHFNLEKTGHKVGKIYGFPLILKYGAFKNGNQSLPILSFDDCAIAECVNVNERVPYSEITKQDLAQSYPFLKTRKDVQDWIVKKYSQSLPGKSRKELLRLGVAITKVKIKKSYQLKVPPV